jgi:hypothetical protein
VEDCISAEDCATHALRGGSYKDRAENIIVTATKFAASDFHDNTTGFRIARDAEQDYKSTTEKSPTKKANIFERFIQKIRQRSDE